MLISQTHPFGLTPLLHSMSDVSVQSEIIPYWKWLLYTCACARVSLDCCCEASWNFWLFREEILTTWCLRQLTVLLSATCWRKLVQMFAKYTFHPLFECDAYLHRFEWSHILLQKLFQNVHVSKQLWMQMEHVPFSMRNVLLRRSVRGNPLRVIFLVDTWTDVRILSSIPDLFIYSCTKMTVSLWKPLSQMGKPVTYNEWWHGSTYSH